MKKKVVFYFPWKEISGGPAYLASLARQISQLSEYEVWYIDYQGGLTEKDFVGTNVKQIPYQEPFDFPLHDEIITMVVPIYCAAHIPKLHPQSKILFVNWHNYCIQALVDSWRLKEGQLQEFLAMVYETNSVIFLERSHWLAQNEYISKERDYKFCEQYVPVTITPKHKKCSNTPVEGNQIRIGILGRLCRDKIYSVTNLLRNFDAIDTSMEKHLYVIGDGLEKDLINQVDAPSVQVHMEGTITGDALSNFLCEHVDVLFGMGLSVLEGAAVGLPSVITPHNIYPFTLDAYTFLHECEGCALGWYDTQVKEMKFKSLTLENILDKVYKHHQKYQLGQLALQYLNQYHLDNSGIFCLYLDETKLTYKQFSQFAKDKGYIRIFSLPIAKIHSSFDERDKQVDFLGISNFLCAKIDGENKRFYLLGREENLIKAKKIGKYYRLYIAGIQVPMVKL